MPRMLGLFLALLSATAPARGDDLVDVLDHDVWARKGGLACDSAAAAADGGAGLFSRCTILPYALRVELVDTPEPATKVYHMRVIGMGDRPLTAWFDRASLTNDPPLADRPAPR